MDGEDRAGPGIHDDAAGAVLGPGIRRHICNPPLQVVLDSTVQGGLDAVAVLGVIVLLVLEHKLRAAGLFCRHR